MGTDPHAQTCWHLLAVNKQNGVLPAVKQGGCVAVPQESAPRRQSPSAICLAEAAAFGLGMLVPFGVLAGFILQLDLPAGGASSVMLLGLAAVLSGVMVLRRALEQEARLRDGEIRLRGLLDNASDGIVLLDVAGNRHLYANTTAAALFGRSVDAVLAANLWELSAPVQASGESSGAWVARLIASAMAGEQVDVPWTFLRADGSTFPARLALSRIEGAGAAVRVSIADLSNDSMLKLARDRAEEGMRAVVEYAPEGVMLVDQQSHLIRYANRAAGRMLGADPALLVGHHTTRAAVNPQPDGRAPDVVLRDMAAEAMAGLESTRHWRVRRTDGIDIDTEVRVILLPGGSNLYRVSIIDQSERVSLETDKQQTEASLRASEIRFRHLARISSDWYWETGLDDRFSLIEGGAEEQRGIMQQFVGRLPWEIRRLEPLEGDWQAVWGCRERREPYRQLLLFGIPEQAPEQARVLEIVADPVQNALGVHVGYRGVARDITERYRAQERQRRSEEAAIVLAGENAAALKRFELIVQSMPVAFMVRDAEHRITLWNPEAERVFGYSRAEALGKTALELIVPPGQEMSDTQRLRTISAGQEMTSGILDNLTKSGMRIQCEWRNARISGPRGEFSGSIAMALDITTRVNAERALQESEVHFRRLTELASDCKWETDADHRFVELVADADGITRTDALGKRRWELAHLRPVNCSWEEHRATVEAQRRFSNLIIEVHGADGRRYYRVLSGEPRFDAKHNFLGYRGLGTDILSAHRANLRRSGEAQLFEALSRGASLAVLMMILCEMVEASTERPSRASVLLVEGDCLRHLAAPRLPEAYCASIDGMAIGELEGSCGAAASLGQTVIAHDIATDARWDAYREAAGMAGVRACWSTPVRGMGSAVIATFDVYTDVAHTPSAGDLDLTDAAARLAALVMERHRSTEALRESEERLRKLVTLSSDWEWEQDEQFRFTRATVWSDDATRFLSTPVGHRRWDNPQLRPIGFTWDEHRRLLEAREPFSHTLIEFTNLEGRRFYWAIRGEPVFDARGTFSGYRGVGSDITVRYRNDAMRLGERALFESMAQGEALPKLLSILAHTIHGVLERVGGVIVRELDLGTLRVLASFGVSAAWSEVLAKGVTLELDATSCAEAARRNSAVIFEDVSTDDRCASVRQSLMGAGIRASWSMPVFDRAGAVIATIGIAYPAAAGPSESDMEFVRAAGRLAGFVIERFRSTEAARESAERYRRLVEQSQDGVLIHEWGIIEYANTAFVRMIGAKSMGALIGLNAVKLYTRESQSRSGDRLARLRQSGEALPFAEMQLQRLDGTLVEVEVAASMFESHGRQLVQSQFRDISARKWTEREILKLNQDLEQRVNQRTAELTAANRELEAFSYTVAHDLRAPLRAIDGFSQLLQGDIGEALNADAQRDINAISTSTRKMSELINGLLEFSRYGRGVLTGQRVDTAALVAVVAEEGGRGRAVRFDIGRLEDVHGDPIMLRQVWANLIGNAIKFSAKRDAPVVSIDCQNADRELLFTVSDNGEGFDMAYVDKLFGVFQRLHSASEFEGTGVGLAIVKRIVERHGGRIWAESSAAGGAIFRFTLPRHEAPTPALVH